MLADSKLMGFIFTHDYEKARAFYEGKLGFKFLSQDQFALAVRAGEHMIRIVKMPDFTPARATVLGWDVMDIQSMVTWLKGRGVIFEDYPFIQNRDSLIWEAPGGNKIAWFKDPDGNVLSVSQHT